MLAAQTNPHYCLLFTLLRQDPSGAGFSHLGMDGIFRSFDGNGRVLDYRALSLVEIAEVVKIFPAHMRTQLEPRLEGVDGRNVTDLEDLLHPSGDLMPSFGNSDSLGHEAGADEPVGNINQRDDKGTTETQPNN